MSVYVSLVCCVWVTIVYAVFSCFTNFFLPVIFPPSLPPSLPPFLPSFLPSSFLLHILSSSFSPCYCPSLHPTSPLLFSPPHSFSHHSFTPLITTPPLFFSPALQCSHSDHPLSKNLVWSSIWYFLWNINNSLNSLASSSVMLSCCGGTWAVEITCYTLSYMISKI